MTDSHNRVERFYRPLIGDRAAQLRALKTARPLKVARCVAGRFNQTELLKLIQTLNLAIESDDREFSPSPFYDDAVLIDAALASALAGLATFDEGLFYLQTVPSYLVIRHLSVGDAEYALDICASPGGKGLHLYDRFDRGRPVILNEYSRGRRAKLASVLKTYHAEELPILGLEASDICRYVANTVPLIVLDAPCSGEAHLLRNPKQLSQWRPRQTIMLALRQRAMAIGAIHALRPGGLMLYATCTISPYENELLGQEVLKKFGSAVEPVAWPIDIAARMNFNAEQIGAVDRVESVDIDPRITRAVWRFWPAAFGEPFFGMLIRKVEPTEPKRLPNPSPIAYPHDRSKRPQRIVRVGPAGREYLVPKTWPQLPALPYIRMGIHRRV